MIFHCKNIHGKALLYIRCRRDDRLRAEQRRAAAGEPVRAAHVAGQQRNHKMPAFIDHQDRRVQPFAPGSAAQSFFATAPARLVYAITVIFINVFSPCGTRS